MPGLRGQWARWWGLGKRSFLTAAPLVLPGSCGPAGITPQTRLRGPAAGLSDPLGWGMILHGSRTVPELQAPGG
ncbi:hypothetical protein CapIbe_001958 [Capra ibex]